jgi:Limiting CO2-inducible proteins B/C beta carbonyic anhydrases
MKRITYGDIPSLLELTHIARKVIQEDLELAIGKVVDTSKSDYAMLTGIQIHAPDGNYIWPAESYVVINGVKSELKVE